MTLKIYKQMTKDQQQIIDTLINEFNKINQSNNANNGFNLIDIKPLKTKTTTLKEWSELRKADEIAWQKLANEECYRIIELLKQDIPNACIQKYSKCLGGSELPKIIISNNEEDFGYSNRTVTLEVKVLKVGKLDEYKQYYEFGDCLVYKPYPNAFGHQSGFYKTLEKAVSDKAFLEAIRTRILR